MNRAIKTEGGPAFSEYPNGTQGLTKREWYKGMIIQGMNASPELMEAVTKVDFSSPEALHMMGMSVFERMAEKAGEQADAMIAEDIAFRKSRES